VTGEDISMVSAANDYAGISRLLQLFAKLVAITHAMSPNDFSPDQVSAASGFAKMVDNLPKLQIRDQRVKWFSLLERTQGWPRIASVLRWLGVMPGDIGRYRLQVEFKGARFPLSISERVAEEQHDLSLGITTPAKILADKANVSVDQAEAAIADNRGAEVDDPPQISAENATATKEVLVAVGSGEMTPETAEVFLRGVLGLPAELAAELRATLDAAKPEPEPAPAPEPEMTMAESPEPTEDRVSLLRALVNAPMPEPRGEEEDAE